MITDTIQMDIDHRALSLFEGNMLLLQQQSAAGRRPYIHPLYIPGADFCLTEDSPEHHPWQHGIYTGFHGVAGSDFWLDQGESVGRIEPSKPEQIDGQTWSVTSAWRHHQGHVVLQETQQWTLQIEDGRVHLDLLWSLNAPVDIEIEQHAYGGLFIRMPFRHALPCHVINSNGQTDDDCEQQTAAWLAMDMQIPDTKAFASMAVFHYPQNGSPEIEWRVDGTRGINPSPVIAGALRLKKNQERQWRYRIIASAEKNNVTEIEGFYQQHIATNKGDA